MDGTDAIGLRDMFVVLAILMAVLVVVLMLFVMLVGMVLLREGRACDEGEGKQNSADHDRAPV